MKDARNSYQQMHINVIFTEYLVYIGTGTTKLIGKPCYSVPLLTKSLFDKLSYVHCTYKKGATIRYLSALRLPPSDLPNNKHE